MEAAFFLFDALMVTILVFNSMHNDRLRDGKPEIGLFRMPSDDKQDQS